MLSRVLIVLVCNTYCAIAIVYIFMSSSYASFFPSDVANLDRISRERYKRKIAAAVVTDPYDKTFYADQQTCGI